MSKQLLVCTNFRANPNNPSCAARDSQLVLIALKTALVKKNIVIETVESPCMGYCKVGPTVRLVPNGEFFYEVSAKKLANLIKTVEKFTAD